MKHNSLIKILQSFGLNSVKIRRENEHELEIKACTHRSVFVKQQDLLEREIINEINNGELPYRLSKLDMIDHDDRLNSVFLIFDISS